MDADSPVTDVDTGRPIDPRTLGLGLLREIDEDYLTCPPLVAVESAWSSLWRMGVRGPAINGRGAYDALGWQAVVFLERGRFEFARFVPGNPSAAAVIIPVADEHGDLVDLAAWSIDENRLAMLRGAAPALGLDNLARPRLDGPLVVHENVLSWLRDGRRGLYILDAPRAAQWLQGTTLAVEREAFGRRLADRLTVPPPPIVLRKPARRAA